MNLSTKLYESKPDLNITPLVDVMLVLLAILMVTAPVMKFEEQINLPTGSKQKTLNRLAKLDIIMNAKREIFFKGKKYSMVDFPDNFNLLSRKIDKNTPVFIQADKNLKYDNVMFLLKTTKEVGFLKVSLITNG